MRFKKLFPLVCADYIDIDTDEGKVVFIRFNGRMRAQ